MSVISRAPLLVFELCGLWTTWACVWAADPILATAISFFVSSFSFSCTYNLPLQLHLQLQLFVFWFISLLKPHSRCLSRRARKWILIRCLDLFSFFLVSSFFCFLFCFVLFCFVCVFSVCCRSQPLNGVCPRVDVPVSFTHRKAVNWRTWCTQPALLCVLHSIGGRKQTSPLFCACANTLPCVHAQTHTLVHAQNNRDVCFRPSIECSTYSKAGCVHHVRQFTALRWVKHTGTSTRGHTPFNGCGRQIHWKHKQNKT